MAEVVLKDLPAKEVITGKVELASEGPISPACPKCGTGLNAVLGLIGAEVCRKCRGVFAVTIGAHGHIGQTRLGWTYHARVVSIPEMSIIATDIKPGRQSTTKAVYDERSPGKKSEVAQYFWHDKSQRCDLCKKEGTP